MQEQGQRLLDEVVGTPGADFSEIDDYAYWGIQDQLEEIGTPQALAAAQILGGKRPEEEWNFSRIIQTYIQLKARGETKDNKALLVNMREWISVNGDRDMNTYRRLDIKSYEDALIARGVKTTTVKKRIAMFKAAVNLVNNFHEAELRNPFQSYQVANYGHDAGKRGEFTPAQLDYLREFSEDVVATDEVALLMLSLLDTGCRLAEIAGLLKSDVFLDDDIPHIVIRPHPHRRLKNRTSERVVPLVGISKWAIERRYKNSKSKFLFYRYNKTGETQTGSASAAIIKRLKLNGIKGVSSHSFRHSMATRLREVETPYEITQFILGHATAGITSQYGSTQVLTQKQDWLLKIIV